MLAQHSVKISKKGSREILFHRFGNLGRLEIYFDAALCASHSQEKLVSEQVDSD